MATIINTNGGTDFSSVLAVIAVNTSGQYEPNIGTGGGGGGTGNVTGPGSSTDKAVVIWNGTTGTAIQNSTVLTDAAGSIYPAGNSTQTIGRTNTDHWSGIFVDYVENGITFKGNLATFVSGTNSIGNSATPFAAITANQYGTTLVPVNPGGAATTITFNWDRGASQTANFNPGLSGNVFATFQNPVAGSTYMLQTTQNPSGTTNLYFPSILWQGGVSGVMTASGNAVDVFRFFYNGSTYLGSQSANYR